MADGNEQHLHYLRLCLDEARKSPPKPSNFCVGALLLDASASTPRVLCTGYTLECPGNTHAEQCCFQKLADTHSLPEERVGDVLPDGVVLYTTMEPCWVRLSGNLPCVQRIVRAGKIKKVVSGVREPEKFVGENEGRGVLEKAGIECIYVPGLEEDILKVATAGHAKENADV
jgi:pyrimidine deaminase RibD-like protein